jgi:ribosomal protein L31
MLDQATWDKLITLEGECLRRGERYGRRQIGKTMQVSDGLARMYEFALYNRDVISGNDAEQPSTPSGWDCLFTTVQRDGEGKVVRRWDRERPTVNLDDLQRFLINRVPASKLDTSGPTASNKDLMLEWPVFDPHHGMLAWAKETGADYDHKISQHLQVAAGQILFNSFGYVKRITIVLGGDNQTSDNRDGTTEKSGNNVDTDSRFGLMAWCSYETAVSCIEVATQFADEVAVIVLSGNHDYHSAIHLTIQLHAHFRNVEKVTVNTSPEKHRFYTWGNKVFMATHGEVTEKRIAPFAMQQVIRRGYAKDPNTRIYVRMGHLHKRGRKTPDMLTEEDGVIIERFPTLAAQEAYSVEGAYTSVRATEANLWHHKYNGKFGGREVTIGEILERYPYKEKSTSAPVVQ